MNRKKHMKEEQVEHEHLVQVPVGVSGDWAIDKFTVEEGDPLCLYYALHGRPVPAGTYTRLLHKGATIMSDTPAEWLDHAGFIHRARGRVLVTGLGIGMVVNALLKKEEVEHVTVVEKEIDVCRLVGPIYQGPRCNVVHGDAYLWLPLNEERFDCAWHDVWPTICADNLPQMAQMRRHFARFMRTPARQECWCERQCKYMKEIGY